MVKMHTITQLGLYFNYFILKDLLSEFFYKKHAMQC